MRHLLSASVKHSWPVFVWCALVAASSQAKAPPLAQKIVSLDYCADQYVLQFAETHRILALSPDATKPFSYLRKKAQGIPQLRPLAEDVLLAQPDLVVRSYGGGPNALRFFDRSGIRVLQVGYANGLTGIKQVTSAMAAGLGVPEKGAALVARIDERLAAISRARGSDSTASRVLYMTTGGATSGPGTLVHEMFVAAGLENFQDQPGWRSLPLERLAYDQPERVALARFNANVDIKAGKEQRPSATQLLPDRWSAVRHPVAQRQLRTRPTTTLDGAWTSCGAWFLLDAIEALASAPGTDRSLDR